MGWSNLIIKPDSLPKKLWDSFILILLSLNIFYVPIKITWEDSSMGGLKLNSWVQIFLNDLPGWTFLVDIIFNFNTAYFSKGQAIYNRKKIMKNYLKTKFLGDLLVVIPFIVSLKLNLILLNSILLLRTNKMFKLAYPKKAALYNLCKLVFTIVFVAHFAGCMFFLVGSYQIQSNIGQKTWIEAANMQDKQWYEQYVTSLYWAVITMITIGYGDITPITIYERAFVILITLMSCGVFAYSLNQIGVLIQALTQSSNQLKQKMNLLTRHLRHRGVSHSLQMQVRKYFEYWHQSNEENDGEECDKMIESLSNNLKKEVLNDIRIRLIYKIPILCNNFSNSFLKNIANHIKTKRTKPEEILIEESQINERLYFLVSGQMISYINIRKDDFLPYTTIKSIKPNAIFDQMSFMADLPCLTGYRSVGSCMLYYINKEDFLQEIKNFPQDQEKYQLIKDNIDIYKSQRNINTRCNFCDKYTHQMDRCPYIKYIPYSDKTLILYRVSIEQVRMQPPPPLCKRRDTRHEVLTKVRYSKERAVQYLIENNPFKNEEELIERLELVNFGEQEFYEQYNINIENQTNRTNLTYIQEEKYNKEMGDQESEILDHKQNSVIIQPDFYSPIPKIQQNAVFFANRGYTNHDSSLVAAGAENNSNYDPIGAKNNSNLNSIFSVYDNQLQQPQILQPQNQQNITVNTPSQQTSQQQGAGGGGGGYVLLENSITDTNNQIQDSNQLTAQLNMQVQNLSSCNSSIKKKGIKIAKSPQQKKKNVDLNTISLQKQKEILGQYPQGQNNFTNQVAFNILNSVSPSQGSSNFKFDFLNKKKTVDETEIRCVDSEIPQLSSMDQVLGNIIPHPKKKSFNKMHTATDQSIEEVTQSGILEKKINLRKNSEKRNQTINNIQGLQISLNNIEQEGYQNINRRSSTTSRQISIQQLQQNVMNPNPNSLQYLNQNLHTNSLQNYNNQQPNHLNQFSLALTSVQRINFMPLMDFDKMKEFTIYYPSGNYKKVIEKIENLYQKRAEKLGKNKHTFKRSVNKIMQICQLQNMILRKTVHPFKTLTPATKKSSTLIQQQDSLKVKQSMLNKKSQSHHQSSFQLAKHPSSFSTQIQEKENNK